MGRPPSAPFAKGNQLRKGKISNPLGRGGFQIGVKPAAAVDFQPGFDPRRNLKGPAKMTDDEKLASSLSRKALRADRLRKEEIVKEAKEVQDIARSHAAKALEALSRIVDSQTAPDSAVIQAAGMLLDRGYGKAAQTNINANLDANADPKAVTATDLNKRIEAALRRVEGITGGELEEEQSEERPTDIRELH
jgi:hypothetical protein